MGLRIKSTALSRSAQPFTGIHKTVRNSIRNERVKATAAPAADASLGRRPRFAGVERLAAILLAKIWRDP